MPSLHAFAGPKVHFLFACALSLGLSGCGPVLDLLDPLLNPGKQPSATPSSTVRPTSTPSPGASASPLAGTADTPQALVSVNTSPETKSLTAAAGKVAQIQLGDGTQVQTPAANAPFVLTLARQSNDLKLAYTGLEKTGSLRVLQLQNLETNAVSFPITLRFPASEAGRINKDTLGVARVADEVVNGVLQKDHFTLLPAAVDNQGQITAVDYLFPQLSGMQISQVGPLLVNPLDKFNATIKYFLVTLQSNLNWAAAPQLVRMVPDDSLPEKRKPLEQLVGKARLQEENKCVRNVLVLVHGHNEAEKDGYLGQPDVAAPWNFSYKRDVWTPLYQTYLKSTGLQARSSCTAFYEYVYPSFRPAFDSLGPELADKIKTALQPLLANPDADPNLLIVAHSMGGLVARAGIQKFDAPLQKAFQRLMTWGTPHRGSALVSFSYALSAGDKYSLLGLADIDLANNFKSLAGWLQLDTPGTRDLRWDNDRPLNLDTWFEKGPTQATAESDIYSLTKGSRLYNARLQDLNRADLYAAGSGGNNRVGQPKYFFAYGSTGKVAHNGLIDSQIGLGATLTRHLIQDPDKSFENDKINANDGAVPVTSAGGEGLNAERRGLNDVDHEEFYGAARGPASFNGASSFDQLQKGLDVATLTFDKLYLAQDSLTKYFGCDPFIRVITPQQGIGGTAVQLKGRCFNNADEKLAVYFNHQKAQNISVKNCNEITANAPDNLTSGDVTVVANGLTSNGVLFSLTASPSPTPSPSPQSQALCSDIDFAGDWTWSIGKTQIVTIHVKDDGTFTDSEGSNGTWGIWNVNIPGTFRISYTYYKPGSASTKLKSQVFVKNNGFCDELKDDAGSYVLRRIIDPNKPSPSPTTWNWDG